MMKMRDGMRINLTLKGVKMERRNALKILGAIVCCVGASAIKSHAQTGSLETYKLIDSSTPLDFIFDAESMGDIIIRQKDTPNIIIPFSEVIEALKEGK